MPALRHRQICQLYGIARIHGFAGNAGIRPMLALPEKLAFRHFCLSYRSTDPQDFGWGKAGGRSDTLPRGPAAETVKRRTASPAKGRFGVAFMSSELVELQRGKPRKRGAAKAQSRPAGNKVKSTIHLSLEASQRLDVHATMMGMDRSSLVELLINTHLRRFVVS